MTDTQGARRTTRQLHGAVGLFLAVVVALTAAAAPVRAASPSPVPPPSAPLPTGCTVPVVQLYISDVLGPYQISFTARISAVTTPAVVKEYAPGSYTYLTQEIPVEGASVREVVFRPQFLGAGPQEIQVTLTDACGTVYNYVYTLRTPVADFLAPLACPGAIDTNGLCIVEKGTEAALAMPLPATGAPAYKTVLWDDGLDTGQTERRRVFDGAIIMTYVQARAFDADGVMRITPPLPIVMGAAAKPRITEFTVPEAVKPGEPFLVSFVIPAGAEEATPSIYAGDRLLVEGTEAEVRFDSGAQSVAFVLVFPDGSVVSRQVAILVPETPPAIGLLTRVWGNPLGQLLLAALAGLLLVVLVLALLAARRQVRRRLTAWRSRAIRPEQAYRLLAEAGVEVEGVERVRRRTWRFRATGRGLRGATEIEATGIVRAWEALVARVLGGH
jgi:hypothetical protein